MQSRSQQQADHIHCTHAAPTAASFRLELQVSATIYPNALFPYWTTPRQHHRKQPLRQARDRDAAQPRRPERSTAETFSYLNAELSVSEVQGSIRVMLGCEDIRRKLKAGEEVEEGINALCARLQDKEFFGLVSTHDQELLLV